jgi:hypothetical protein
MSSKKNPPPSKSIGASSSDGGSSSTGNHKRTSLNDDYPVNSVMEITIGPSNEKFTGLVYCTDDMSNTIVLRKSVNYTTLSSDIWVLNANSVLEKKIVVKEAPSESSKGNDEKVELAMPLQNVSKDLIEKREKRAIMLAEDSFKHINQKVSHVYLHVHVIVYYLLCSRSSSFLLRDFSLIDALCSFLIST